MRSRIHPGIPIRLATARRVATQASRGGAKSECYTATATAPRWGQIRQEQWGHFRVLQPAAERALRRLEAAGLADPSTDGFAWRTGAGTLTPTRAEDL